MLPVRTEMVDGFLAGWLHCDDDACRPCVFPPRSGDRSQLLRLLPSTLPNATIDKLYDVRVWVCMRGGNRDVLENAHVLLVSALSPPFTCTHVGVECSDETYATGAYGNVGWVLGWMVTL